KRSSKWNYWERAIEDELNALQENETWKLVDKPEDEEVISNRWVFRAKENNKGKLICKARLVARGFEQDEGLEINENYENKVCLLDKAIYGLKQAPKIWNERFNTFMSSLNFKRSKSDY
ncbi:hypothetical protein ILUMI_02881, partial [Ignelater luminosus]